MDKPFIEAFTRIHPPYSDYNFTSLWSYNTKDQAEISQLNENLILKYTDYISNSAFLSFIGLNTPSETALELLRYASEQEGFEKKLKLIPDTTAQQILHEELITEEDPDNHDYILDIGTLIDYKGNSLRGKRNFVHRFQSTHGYNTKLILLDMNDPQTFQDCLEVFDKWAHDQDRMVSETETEKRAIERLFEGKDYLDVHILGVMIGDKLRAFSINEILDQKHGVIHFEKADMDYIGIFPYLKQQSALHFSKHGIEYINYEQDLGLEGLRKAKQSYNPVHFLKKYTVSMK